MIGHVVCVAGQATPMIGVVSSVEDGIAKVLVFQPSSSRWLRARPFPVSLLSEASDEIELVQRAKRCIRRHFGVLPVGSLIQTLVRVWPDSQDPYQKAG